jgi:hypothetical protein
VQSHLKVKIKEEEENKKVGRSTSLNKKNSKNKRKSEPIFSSHSVRCFYGHHAFIG